MMPGAFRSSLEKPKIRVIPGRDLGSASAETWAKIQSSDPIFASPFFRPDFTSAVAAVREDVFVAELECAGESVGYFPYQRNPQGIGGPVGGLLSDYQGVIVGRGVQWDAVELLRGSGLVEWQFDHLLADQKPFRFFQKVRTTSPIIDLSQGYERYAQEHLQGLAELRKRRKLEREIGPIRMETHCANADMFKLLWRWKGKQYMKSEKVNIFDIPWVAEILERVYVTQTAAFAGMLSVLYAGGQPVAAHFGMRPQTTWHYWLPSYDPAFGKYSPGMLLLLEMAAAAPSLGLQTIDFGKGRALYKHRLQNGSVALSEGLVPTDSLRCWGARVRYCGETLFRRSPMVVVLRKLRRTVKGLPRA